MPGAWKWYAAIEGDEVDGFGSEADTKEAAIADLLRSVTVLPNERIVVIEARMSSAMKYEGEEFVPFTHQRNRQVVNPHIRGVS